jgi:hypothetical protein
MGSGDEDIAGATTIPSSVEVEFGPEDCSGKYKDGLDKNKGEFDELLTFKQVWSFKSVLILFGIICVAGGHLTFAYAFSSSSGIPFEKLDREFIWLFLLFAAIFLYLAYSSIFRWKKDVKSWVEKAYGKTRHGSKKKKKVNLIMEYYRMYIDACGLDGKFYLPKLFLMELVENWIQFFNLKNIYLCTLEMGFTIPICVIMLLESLFRAVRFAKMIWGEDKEMSTKDRNAQIQLDIFIDLTFAIVPMSLIYFMYGIDLRIGEVVLMVIPPSFGLFGKLRRMIRETLRNTIEELVVKSQMKKSFRVGRRRQSMFGVEHSLEVKKMQNKYIPRPAKFVIFIASAVYVILMLVVIIVQSASYGAVDGGCQLYLGGMLWKDGCKVKVPFCKSMFERKCDCAYFELKNHNVSTFPDEFTSLTAMRKIHVENGPLYKLPDGMEKLDIMSSLEISSNRLKEFDVDISNWPEIVYLFLYENELTSINENVWKSSTLVNLDLGDNLLSNLPSEGKINMPNLLYLNVNNNNVTVPASFGGIGEFPKLRFLFMVGNKMETFPDRFATLHSTLRYLAFARSNVSTFPPYFAKFEKLTYFDARDNNIKLVDNTIINLWKGKGMIAAYFAGNPVCPHEGLDCKPLCSKFCWLRTHKNDGICDLSCYSESCDWDGDDCPHQKK